jgi:hypothetical protein
MIPAPLPNSTPSAIKLDIVTFIYNL